MEMLKPILIAVAILFIVWVVLSISGFKFKNLKNIFKSKKPKEASKTEKEKEFIPNSPKFKPLFKKRKPEEKSADKKEEKPDKKEEPAATAEDKSAKATSEKVSKITKADFEKNNIEVPKNSPLLSPEERAKSFATPASASKQKMTSPIGAKPFENINMPPISLFDDNDLMDDDGDEDEFEAFLRARKGEKPQTAPAETEVPSPKYELNEYNSILPTVSAPTETSVPFITSSLEDRYAQVFGGKVVVPDGSLRARDIVIGSVIATPKAKQTEKQKLKNANKFKIM